MKKNSLKMIGLAAFSLLVVFSSCKKKSDDPAPAAVAPATALSGNSFNLSAENTNLTASGQSINQAGTLDACDKSDVYKFATTGAYTVTQTTSCGGDIETGTWKLSTKQDSLYITEDGEKTGYKIDTDASGNFVLSSATSVGGGGVETESVTFTKIK